MTKIQSNGRSNAQVSDEVKDELYQLLENEGLNNARDAVHFHHYCYGEWVAMSLHGHTDIYTYNEIRRDVLADNRTKNVSDDTVWLHRDWIQSELPIEIDDS